MTEQSPSIKEAELRRMEMERDARLYSYDLVQRLTFFIISLELIFCGYILLNAEKLGAVRFSSVAFLLAGMAAIIGLLWRFLYNQDYNDFVHGTSSWISPPHWLKRIVYWVFVILTSSFLILSVIIGYLHIDKIEKAKEIQNLKEELATQKQLNIDTSDNKREKENNKEKRLKPNERK